eukprot:5901224-Pleurochrysis_carterae.AAC.1
MGTQGRGEGGGRRRWRPRWVRSMVMEPLVHGTPPIELLAMSDAGYLVPWVDPHVISINFCMRIHRELYTVTETLGACHVA